MTLGNSIRKGIKFVTEGAQVQEGDESLKSQEDGCSLGLRRKEYSGRNDPGGTGRLKRS